MTAITAETSPAAARLFAAMDAAGKRYQQCGPARWRAQCPAHDDRDPSMTVDWLPADGPSRAGRVMVDCKAGCERDSIPAALGLTWRDLMDGPSELGRSPGGPERPAGRRRPSPASRTDPRPRSGPHRAAQSAGEHAHRFDYRRPEASHVYTDAAGEVVARVDRVRCSDPDCPSLAEHGRAGKTFVTRHPDGRKGKPAELAGVLYRLPALAAAVAAGRPVYVCEGEGDADAVAAAGECGTSAYGGAKSAWHPGYTAALAGAHVVIVADRDAPGYARAAAAAELLAAVAASVRVVQAAVARPGADVSDHLAAGYPLAALADVPGPAPAAVPPPRSGEAAVPPAVDLAQVTDPDTPPRYRLPASTGAWAYATGDDGDGRERGVYRLVPADDDDGPRKVWQWTEVLPYVYERVAHRDGAGRRARMSYRIGTRLDAPADERAVVGHLAVKDGSWAEPLGVPLSADDKVIKAVASAIYREAERSAPMVEAAPRWTPAGTLDMPPADVGPAGYGVTAGTEAAARQSWTEIGGIMRRNPKTALTAGAAQAAPYVAALRRQSFVVHLAGRDRRGKTTAEQLAAATYGDPEVIIRPWDASAIGLTALAGEYGCLPPIFDELGARNRPKSELQAIVFQLAQGARRTKSQRDGRSTVTAPWRGVVLSTGNVSLLSNLTERGAIARVIEIPTPILGTRDDVDDPAAAADAARLDLLTAEAYGWPFVWVRAAGITPERFAALLAAAVTDLDCPAGGTLGTLARHLAAAVAGAAVLDVALGTDTLRPAALTAAAELLAELAERLAEIAATPDERLGRAVAHAVISRPEAFPALGDLRDPEAGRRYRDGEGFTIGLPPASLAGTAAAARYEPPPGLAVGDVGVLCDLLPKVGAEAGLEDVVTALRGLRDAGRLITGGEKGGAQLRRSVRIRGMRADVYVFRLADLRADDDDTPANDAPPPPAPAPAPAPAAELAPSAAAAPPADPPAGGGGPAAERYPLGPVLLADDGTGYLADGAEMGTPDTLADLCDLAASVGIGTVRLHRYGRDSDPHLYLTAAACQRYGIPAEPPDDDARRTLALPEDHPAAVALRAAGWNVQAIRTTFQVWRPGPERASVSVTLLGWVPHIDPLGLGALLDDGPSPASLAARLGRLAALTLPAAYSAGVTSERMMRALRPESRRRLDPVTGERVTVAVPGSLPGPVTPSLYDAPDSHPAAAGRPRELACREEAQVWTRPLDDWTADERAAPWAVTLDTNAAFLAAASDLPLGLSAPRPMTAAEVEAFNADPAAALHRRAGVFVAEVAGLAERLDPRLPCPLTETGTWPDGPLPLHAPSLRYALECGGRVTVTAGAVHDECGPWLTPWQRRISAALADVLAAAGITPAMDPAAYVAAYAALRDDHPDAHALLAAIKALYKAGIGRMRQSVAIHPEAAARPTWRPDMRAEVISAARVSLHRKIAHVAALTGAVPLAVNADAVTYASPDADPLAVVPRTLDGAQIPGAIRVGPRPGWFKHSHSAPMAEVLAHVQAGGNPAVKWETGE